MSITRRKIKNWWSFLRTKPISPGLEKLNILITAALTIVSTFLALITFKQQQEIKGMNSLLIKQDSIITYLAQLSRQNGEMISRLDNTQNYIIEQIDAVKSQTKSNEYSSKPVLDVMGYLSLTVDLNTKQYKIAFPINNYGFRPASMIRVKGAWLKLDKNILTSWLKVNPVKHSESLPPNQSLTFSITKDFTDLELNEFPTLFFVLNIEYYDPLTKKIEKVNTFKRQIKSYEIGLEQRFSLIDVSSAELNILKGYKLVD